MYKYKIVYNLSYIKRKYVYFDQVVGFLYISNNNNFSLIDSRDLSIYANYNKLIRIFSNYYLYCDDLRIKIRTIQII
jgi:hypothetical protein